MDTETDEETKDKRKGDAGQQGQQTPELRKQRQGIELSPITKLDSDTKSNDQEVEMRTQAAVESDYIYRSGIYLQLI